MDTAVYPIYARGQQAANAADDKTATLTAWLDEYATDILRLCFCYLGNRADAEDALQETFIKAWRHMEQYEARGLGNPKSWLLKIAVNTCRDALRGPWHKKIDHSVDIDLLTSMQAAPQEDRDLLLDITMLPPKYKEVILLHYYQGMTLREISQMLHCAESSISRRLNKACMLLRQTKEGENV